MPIINLFDTDQSGKSKTVTAQSHLNLYCEIKPNADKSRLVFYGTPGLILFTTFGDTPIRGWVAIGDYIYAVHRGTFWQVDNAGIKTSRGTLTTTSGRVSLSYNGTQIGIVDGTSMYCFTIASLAFATVVSALFSNPIDITYQDGYGIACFNNSQRRQISSNGDFLTWNALDFDAAESNPDALVRVLSDHGEVVSCGVLTTEFSINAGATDYPFTTLKNATLPFGLAAPWSLTQYNDSLAGLFKSAMGQVQVMVLRGHALSAISTQEIDSIINGYSAVSDATAFSYMLGGHPMLEINFPTAGKSWLYDASTGMWTGLESGLSGGRHYAEMRVDYLNKPRVSDYTNGSIYTLDANTYTDNGTSIPRELISRHVFNGTARTTINRLEVQFESGVGLATGQGSDPQVMLQISRDGGKTFGNEMWRSIGAIGNYLTRAFWTRLGTARDWIFKFRITDPVKVVITIADADMEVRK